MKNFKCKNCGKTAKCRDYLQEIWDVYYEAGLCPDCSDSKTRLEVTPKLKSFLKYYFKS